VKFLFHTVRTSPLKNHPEFHKNFTDRRDIYNLEEVWNENFTNFWWNWRLYCCFYYVFNIEIVIVYNCQNIFTLHGTCVCIVNAVISTTPLSLQWTHCCLLTDTSIGWSLWAASLIHRADASNSSLIPAVALLVNALARAIVQDNQIEWTFWGCLHALAISRCCWR